MATASLEAQDRFKMYKFTKILTLKVAQIVVQSRQGKKITHECNIAKPAENDPAPPPANLQWFNLSIPDEPEVNIDTKRVLNGEVVDALARVLCIEISLRTSDGDEMVLELWTVKMTPGCDMSLNSVSTIYYRMSIMLKSTLSISRITPAYKMSRSQDRESYKISHKIYGGEPDLSLLGDERKSIKVSELRTPIGTILIEVVYRTKMEINPSDKQKVLEQLATNNDIMVKSDHFYESPKKAHYDKKEVDLSKPLTAGAFVDTVKIKELHDALNQQLPPEPPMSWLLAEKEKMENKMKQLSTCDNAQPGCSGMASTSAPYPASKAIEVPKAKNGDKYSNLMECLQARSASDGWTDIVVETSASTDSESLSQQLKMFEDAVPEFDNMVASMFSNSENGSDNS